MSRIVVWCGGGGCNKRTLCAYTPRHNNNIPCVCVSILLCSSPDVNETEIEIWREKTHYYTKVIFTIFVYYNVGSNLASTPQRLSADISPSRRPFRSERFKARRRRRRRPRRATKKPYNSNNNNTIVLYYTVAFVCVSHSRRAEDRREFITELAIFKNGFTSAILNNRPPSWPLYQLNNMLLYERAQSIRILIKKFAAAESNIIIINIIMPTWHCSLVIILISFNNTSQRHDVWGRPLKF